MKNEAQSRSQAGYLIYDSHCRLCVTVKRTLERRHEHVRFIPYDSQQAAECLGESHQPGSRPSMAYWVDEQGTVVGGPEAFLPLLQGHASGKIFMFFWKFHAWRRIILALYEFVARYRYRWFGVQRD